MNSFKDISLPESLTKAISTLKFETPTPIQAAAIPLAIQGKDLMASAQTGTGKTVAFSIPIILKVLANPKSKALILTPTRELAAQVSEVIRDLAQFTPQIRWALLIGGAAMNRQIRALQKTPSIIIATPGRLTDHAERGGVDLSQFQTVVLDEADRMLDMGFAPQIERILKYLPHKRQVLLFSATLPPNILKLAQKYMTQPQRVSVGSVDRAVVKIKQSHIEIEGAKKNDRILTELKARSGPILVFARTKLRTDRLSKFLIKNGVKAAAIHGGRSQSQRNAALAGFRSYEYPVLIATDVASRGLDIPQIELVINFDLPQTAEDYIHRIGRTARAGANGEAMSFVTREEISHWKMISKQGGPDSSSGGRSDSGRSRGQYSQNKPRGSNSRFQTRGSSGGGRYSSSSPGSKFSPRNNSQGGSSPQRSTQEHSAHPSPKSSFKSRIQKGFKKMKSFRNRSGKTSSGFKPA